MHLTFYGAAGEVTGSQHLLETDELRVLFDCGLFQGHRAESRAKNERFHCDPEDLDGVILSHAHIDHCGNLPGLYRAGYRGPIFATPATTDVAELMLRDSARIQEEDAKFLSTRLEPGHPSAMPLYTEDDVKQVMKLFQPLEVGQWHNLASDFSLRFSEAGHIIGSAITEVQLKDEGEWRQIIFTGDLGRRGMSLLPEPTLLDECEVLICESTYANRVHPPLEAIREELVQILHAAEEQNGRVIIPAFSLGRTQQLLWILRELWDEERLPWMPIFVDSPLSSKLMGVYRYHTDVLNDEAKAIVDDGYDLFAFPPLMMVGSQRESAELNLLDEPFVVISASGMCESGRVRHHLKHALSDPRHQIVLIGYQAAHTTGRRLQEKHPTIRMFDQTIEVKATVHQLSGLSAHADATDFAWWCNHLASRGGIAQAFIVHGERDAAQAMSNLLRNHCNEDPIIPDFGVRYEA